jgi:Transposase DNA-binding/Transposase Tn5 dimerisation domain
MTPAASFLAPLELWAAAVADEADLPDERLNARFAQVLATLAAKPLDSFPQACGSADQAKAMYRFLSNPRFAADDLLQPLVDATVEGCRAMTTVYAIQDSTSFNYSSLTQTTGLGPLNDSKTARGVHLHTTLAVRADGVAIGLLHQEYGSRPTDEHTAVHRRQRPMEEKESNKWLTGLEAAATAVEALPASERPRLIHVMDREGDIHEVFEWFLDRRDGAVIRCSQNRSVDGSINKAYDAMAASPLVGTHQVEVAAQHGRPKRTAVCELRAVTLTITPDRLRHPKRQPVTWTLVEAREINAPAGVEPLHWRLWTTEPADTLKQIIAVLAIYGWRWRIEDFHLTLKSGCQVEALELETSERLTKALTLYSAVAVRIVALRDLAHQQPDLPCTTILSDDAWRVLHRKFSKKPLKRDTPVPSVKRAILWIGRLGGHLNRKRDGLPGVRTLWRGWRDLTLLVMGYRLPRELD